MVPPNEWQENKSRILELSAYAADNYDITYEHSYYATGSYMRYELQEVRKLAGHTISHLLAVDVGCGTGRISFELSKYFSKVYAFDISREKIRVAQNNKILKGITNILFDVRDAEDVLPIRTESVDFLVASFGMGSLVRNLGVFLEEVHRVLHTNGIALLSFYNSNIFYDRFPEQWKIPLAARLTKSKDILQVEYFGSSFLITVGSYTPCQLLTQLAGLFGIIDLTTYPAISSLFPNDFLNGLSFRIICDKLDKYFGNTRKCKFGPYILVACRKKLNSN